MCACFANIIILIEFFVCCCKNEIILEECVCVPSRCRHHHCDCIWHIFFSFYLDCSPACINREHIAGWGVSFIRIPSNKNTHTHTRTHEMRLTLDKAFCTCLEFHPSQFYNRMKHKAWKERRKKQAHHPYFFCNWRSCFCFYIILLLLLELMRSPETFWRLLLHVSYGLTTTTATAIRIHLFSQWEMCPFNIDFTYHIQMRSLLSGMNNEKLCLCLPAQPIHMSSILQAIL